MFDNYLSDYYDDNGRVALRGRFTARRWLMGQLSTTTNIVAWLAAYAYYECVRGPVNVLCYL